MIKGRMVYIGGPKAMKASLRPIVKEALQDMGALWHRRYLPQHFRPGAASKYGYQPRSAAYMKRKASRKRHQRPLEFSGDYKREVSRKAVLSGTSKRVRVVMDVGPAWYATRTWKTRRAPDIPAETTATTPTEVKRLARIGEQFTERKLNAIQTRETRA